MTFLVTSFVGDSITLGTGDGECLGWPARIAAAEGARGHDITVYNLGVRAHTTAQIRARWRAECEQRLPDHLPGHLVFNFGTNDTRVVDGKIELPAEESAANARATVEEGLAWQKPVLWVGQVPVDETNQPLDSIMGVQFWFTNERIRETNDAFKAIAAELKVPFLDLFSAFIDDPAWTAEHTKGDSVHPTTAGYAMMAERISAWDAWRAWLD